MIIFTALGILTAIFFFVISLMAILESGVKRRKNEKLLKNMQECELLKELNNE